MMRNKNFVTGAVIVVVVLLAAGVVLAMRKSDNTKSASSSSDSSMSSMDMSKDSSNNTNEAPSNTNSVTIKDYAFSPANITVKVGTKVTWTNDDSVGHTVTADDPSSDAPASGTFGKGETYSFTFNKAGTYDYHCEPHPYMKGTVTVTE
jgi:amicyanin